ncbi:MAG: hypothetical protein IT356_01745 [Gemmatimonadaceae bacterium]|nr:hypothetical protein [Gemmatimonadaceae bacterium]
MGSPGRAALLAIVMLASCESAEQKGARIGKAARERVEAAEVAAATAATAPSTGLWTEAALTRRLVDAGLAPQRFDSVKALQWMGAPVIAYRLGAATLAAYVYADSAARKAAVARLDPVTLAPSGTESPWATPHELVQNNNLLAVVMRGSDRQRDRISTALAAGVGAP